MEKTIADEKEISTLIQSLANQIIEQNKNLDNTVLVGILSSGLPLAERLAKAINTHCKIQLPTGKIDIGLYRDDIADNSKFVTIRETDIPFDINGKQLILVDDVLFHGRTIRAALDGLLDFGRPELIEVAVLIDRGHRELPIFAHYTGKTIETQKSDHVLVKLLEIDGEDRILLKQD